MWTTYLGRELTRTTPWRRALDKKRLRRHGPLHRPDKAGPPVEGHVQTPRKDGRVVAPVGLRHRQGRKRLPHQKFLESIQPRSGSAEASELLLASSACLQPKPQVPLVYVLGELSSFLCHSAHQAAAAENPSLQCDDNGMANDKSCDTVRQTKGSIHGLGDKQGKRRQCLPHQKGRAYINRGAGARGRRVAAGLQRLPPSEATCPSCVCLWGAVLILGELHSSTNGEPKLGMRGQW